MAANIILYFKTEMCLQMSAFLSLFLVLSVVSRDVCSPLILDVLNEFTLTFMRHNVI
jgi:hypothetical protein